MTDSSPVARQMILEPAGWYRARTATVVGNAQIGRDTSVWFGSIIRCDVAPITIGECTNIQDGTIIHCETGIPNRIGSHITVGHRALLHGASIGDRALIGMGAILLSRCEIGEEAVVAAGCVVKEGFVVPPRTVVAGVPGKIVREVSEKEVAALLKSALRYRGLAQLWATHDVVTPEMVREHDEREDLGPFRAGGG
ncbi:MAG: gamma carbonic anhydrase family protein [Planctomycetota bacterium]